MKSETIIFAGRLEGSAAVKPETEQRMPKTSSPHGIDV